jgi:hypothetical protein
MECTAASINGNKRIWLHRTGPARWKRLQLVIWIKIVNPVFPPIRTVVGQLETLAKQWVEWMGYLENLSLKL